MVHNIQLESSSFLWFGDDNMRAELDMHVLSIICHFLFLIGEFVIFFNMSRHNFEY